jgi:hypothetical protein
MIDNRLPVGDLAPVHPNNLKLRNEITATMQILANPIYHGNGYLQSRLLALVEQLPEFGSQAWFRSIPEIPYG